MESVRVKLVATGGTIASRPSAEAEGVTPQIDGAQLLDTISDLPECLEIIGETFSLVSSGDLTYSDLFQFAAVVNDARKEDLAGVVFTQGTDTIEETAFALSLLSNGQTPFVVTGAMRSSNFLGSDGSANVRDSILTVVEMVGTPVPGAVVLNQEIHDPRFVTKMHTSNMGAFQSLSVGQLGWISEDNVHLVQAPITNPVIRNMTYSHRQPDIRLLSTSLGDTAENWERMLQGQPEGVVIEGLGGGHVNRDVADLIKDIAHHIPVVLASRTRSGSVLSKTYGFQGSEIDLLANGLISAGYLTAPKAKVLMSLVALGGGSNADILNAFRQFSS